ncbi:hypothetical protein GLAREA_01224 [Glarea lozoyensis ATCC 20868]|uniref:Magnesium transport protein CorA, transmembrane region n=1 Tax=Glarea lozoyensis (strain ATCC 20868 / MF5171) TaxID=1116229 RepID=S3CFQ8_GLAL2|nr:uncharacterized protein GLAREA_01224 [Glarea lozoyensis ATCC 20868]EPE25312.1 hypothetical protein GLAREA_01224 [Glarea lozoyensis ATCC 20868]
MATSPSAPDLAIEPVSPVNEVVASVPIETASSPAKPGVESIDVLLPLLKEVSETLKDLRNHSARFMKLLDISEAEERAEKRRERRRSSRPSSHGSQSRASSSYSFSSMSSDSEPRRVRRELREEPLDDGNLAEIGERVSVRRRQSATDSREARATGPSNEEAMVEGPSLVMRRRESRRSSAPIDVVVVEERSDRMSSRNTRRLKGGEGVRRNVARIETYQESSDNTEATNSNNENGDVCEEERSESNSQLSVRSTSSNRLGHRSLKGYTSETIEYGSFPHPDLCEQLFGGTSGFRGEGDKDTYYPHLKEKGIIFARDERCSFTFDLASLTNKDDGYDCFPGSFRGGGNPSVLLAEIERVERFSDELRSKGGFFFFRESYLSDKDFRNKVYNGKHVIRCRDNRRHALPKLSGIGRQFSGEFPIVVPKDELAQIAHAHLGYQKMVYHSQQQRLREDVIGPSNINDALTDSDSVSSAYGPLEPGVTYHYRGQPRTDYNKGPLTGWETTGGPGPDIQHREGRQVYCDPHITAPWRRLCVLTGLSRVIGDDPSRIWLSIPLFERDIKVDQGDDKNCYAGSNTSSHGEDDQDNEANDDSGHVSNQYYEGNILEHLSHKQISIRRVSRRRIVKFQFSWYEIIPYADSENRKFSGRLYQDKDKRTIQLQSFMAIGIWQKIDEDYSGDSKFWTLIIMAPAFFYHKDPTDFDNTNASKELNDLIGPLKSVLPTISATLSMVISKIVAHWTKIGDYVDQFVAGQDSFLREKRHDRLLFDDDSFTRSRPYFWAITSTGEFILIIDETLNHYRTVAKWVSKDKDELRKHREARKKLEAVKARFERQRERATELREGLFSASSVVESRISTRLGQNVRLLTYVSIFYLPLAFCAALWAIPNITEAATRTPFIVTAFFVGLATYFIVFNLDSLVTFVLKSYSRFRKGAIKQMTRDSKNSPPNDKWQKRAQGFNRFESDRGETRPSEWYILWYTLLYLFHRSISVENDDGSGYSSETSGSETSESEESSTEDSGSSERSESINEITQKKPWFSGIRERFRKPKVTSTADPDEQSQPEKSLLSMMHQKARVLVSTSTPAGNEESSGDKSWTSWPLKWFRKPKKGKEKGGSSTVTVPEVC